MRNKKKEVLAAVRQWGKALRYASRELKGDKAIVLAATNENPEALKFACPVLESDLGFINELLALIESKGHEVKLTLQEANPVIMARVAYAMCSIAGPGRHLVEYLNAKEIYRLLCCSQVSFIENKPDTVRLT